jgi:UDP-3-O-[3-hydroxymyristoyl] glucosamine N-acyltransferase
VKVDDLTRYLADFKIVFDYGIVSKINLVTLSTPDELKEQSLLFIKDQKIANKLILKNEFKQQIVLILSSSFWIKLNENVELYKYLDEWKKYFAGIAVVDNITLSIAKISLPFYQIIYDSINLQNDGRKNNSVKIGQGSFVSAEAFLGEGVEIGKDCFIHPRATIMARAVIGDGTQIYPHCTVYPRVQIGSYCRLHSGSVIGADGFGYHYDQGQHHKIWHFGGVKIGDQVEIGANSCVDAGAFTATLIGDGTKIDNNVQVGHNCKIGKGVILCGHVAIGGSSIIGDFTVFGGFSCCGDHIQMGKGCQVGGLSGVNCDWPDGSIVAGHPARPLKEFLRGVAYLRKSVNEKNEKNDQ